MQRDKLVLFLITNTPEKLQESLGAHLSMGFDLAVLDGSEDGGPLPAVAAECLFWLRRPGSSIPSRILEGLEQCAHPYVALVADDDLAQASTLSACVDFLDDNSAYCAAQGVFWIDDRPSPYMEEFSPSLEEADPLQRVIHYYRTYSHVFYSVQRREAFGRAWANSQLFWGEGCFFELAQAATLVGSGRIKRLFAPHAVRCPHTPEDAQARYRNHPLSWSAAEPEAFAAAEQRFLELLPSQPPFASLPGAADALRTALQGYLHAAQFENNIPLRHRYLAMLLAALQPEVNPLELLRGLDGDTEERLHTLLHPALEFLFRNGEQFGLPRAWLPGGDTREMNDIKECSR